MIWRIATSPRNRDTKHQIENDWSWEELRVANLVYDALDDAEWQMAQQNQVR